MSEAATITDRPLVDPADVARLGLYETEVSIEYETEFVLVFDEGEGIDRFTASDVARSLTFERELRHDQSEREPINLRRLDMGEAVPAAPCFDADWGNEPEELTGYDRVVAGQSVWACTVSELRWHQATVLAHSTDEALRICANEITEPSWSTEDSGWSFTSAEPVDPEDVWPEERILSADGLIDLEVTRRRMSVSAAYDPNQLTLFTEP